MKLLVLLILFVVLLAVNVGAKRRNRNRSNDSYCRRSRSQRYPVHFQFYEPKGVDVWVPQTYETDMVTVEMYINNHKMGTSGKPCDLCVNATNVANGKFFIQNPDVVVKRSDVIYHDVYFWRDSKVCRLPTRQFRVSGYYLKQRNACNQDSESETDVTQAPITSDQVNENDSKKEILLLEGIINNLVKNYIANPLSLSLYYNQMPKNGTDKLKYVKDAIQQNLKNEDLANSVTAAAVMDNGCVFDVNSALNKLKLIELSRKLKTISITDYDLSNNVFVDVRSGLNYDDYE